MWISGVSRWDCLRWRSIIKLLFILMKNSVTYLSLCKHIKTMQPTVFELDDKNSKSWLIVVAIVTASLTGIPMWGGEGDWYGSMHFLTLLLVFAMLNKRAARITVDADTLLIEYRTAIFFKETKRFTTARLDVRIEGDTLHSTDRKMKVLR